MKIRFLARLGFAFTINFVMCIKAFSSTINEDHIVQQAIALRDKIERISDIAHRHDQAHVQDEGRVVILGKTGCGKTTLVAGYAVNLKGETNSDGVIELTPSCPLPGFEPRYGAAVGTRVPTPCYDPGENVTIWDCPGFGDPRGAEDDILNAFAIDQLFDGSPVKVVLVIQDVDLDLRTMRGANFYDLMSQLVRFFPDENQLQSMLSLVVSQGGRIAPHVRINSLLREVTIAGADTLKINPAIVRLINFLHQKSIRSTSLPLAMDEGPYVFRKEQLVESVKDANFVTNLSVDFTAGLSAEAKLLVVDYAQALNNYIVSSMKNEMTQKFVNLFNDAVDKGAHLSTLREYFKNVKTSLHNLRHVTRDAPLAIVDILSPFVDTTELRKTIEVLLFFKKIRDTISFEVGEWSLALLNNIEPMLDSLATLPQITYDASNHVLTVDGLLINANDINAGLEKYSAAQEVNVFVLNTLWLEEDITAHGTSMNVIAPQWKIAKPRMIDLSGRQGCVGGSGSRGSAGQPGVCGGNGGHFYGKGMVFNQLENLKVNTNGGRGGNGGAGGEGFEGKDGCDGDLNKVTDCKTTTTSSYTEVHFQLNYTTKISRVQQFFRDKGSLGTQGGNGYAGGCGGLGGLGGVSTIVCGVVSTPSIGRCGEQGSPGAPGKGGKGGKHGSNCRGIRITGLETVTTKTQKEKSRYTANGPSSSRYEIDRWWETDTTTTNLPEEWNPKKFLKVPNPSHADDGLEGFGSDASCLQYPYDAMLYDPSAAQQAFARFSNIAEGQVDKNSFVKSFPME